MLVLGLSCNAINESTVRMCFWDKVRGLFFCLFMMSVDFYFKVLAVEKYKQMYPRISSVQLHKMIVESGKYMSPNLMHFY
jgi:hypothetical protein